MEVFNPNFSPGLNSAMHIKACLHINVMFMPWGHGVKRKHPFSPPLHSWYLIGEASASHQGPSHIVPPRGRGKGEAERQQTLEGRSLLAEPIKREQRAPHQRNVWKRHWAIRNKKPFPNLSPTLIFLLRFIANLLRTGNPLPPRAIYL